MADPLSATASVIALAQISGIIISLCHYYRHGFEGALKEITQLLRETQSSVTERLLQLLDEGDAGGEAHLGALSDVVARGGLAEVQTERERLEHRLQVPVSKGQKLSAKAPWPLRESEGMQALESIRCFKDVFEPSLLADATGAVVEIRRDVKILKEDFSSFSDGW